MRRLAVAALTAVLLLVLYLLTWPVDVDPVAWDAPEDRGLTGPFAANDRLAAAVGFDLGGYTGPEDAALGVDGFIYATTREGAVLRVSADDDVELVSRAFGAPLGIEAGPDGALYVADAFQGLKRLSLDGTTETLLERVGDHILVYADDVAVAGDGSVYFSEASTKFGALAYHDTLDASLLDIMEHAGKGFVAVYEPASGSARVLVDGLNFANGVAVDEGETFLLIAETGSYRILKHWLQGPDAGTTEVVLDNLPGFPDNINRGFDGRYWVGLVSPRNALLDAMSDRPFVRKILQRMPVFLRPKPVDSTHVVAIDGDGNVLVDLQDAAARFPMATGVLETETRLYLTTVTGGRLAYVQKDDIF